AATSYRGRFGRVLRTTQRGFSIYNLAAQDAAGDLCAWRGRFKAIANRNKRFGFHIQHVTIRAACGQSLSAVRTDAERITDLDRVRRGFNHSYSAANQTGGLNLVKPVACR